MNFVSRKPNNKKNATASPATEDRYSDVLDQERAKNPDQHMSTTETLSTLPISGDEIKLQNIEPEMDTSVDLRLMHIGMRDIAPYFDWG